MRDTDPISRTGSASKVARRRWIAAALAGFSLSWAPLEATAQTIVDKPPIYRQAPGVGPRGGGLGPGGAIGLGIGLGVLGAIARQNAASAAEPPPRRVRVIEDDDAPPAPATRRDGGKAPPRNRPPRSAEHTPPPAVRVPPLAETRFVPGEVLIEVKGSAQIAPIATRLGLEVLASRQIRLTGTTLHRLRGRDGRSTREILIRLRRERTLAFAQPNWVYTLQQDAAVPPTEITTATPAQAEAARAPIAPAEAVSAPPPAGETVTNVPSPSPAPAVEPTLATAAAAAAAAPQPLPGQYAADKLRLAAAHDRVKGRDVLVAVIDTGADTAHPELAGAVEASFDALDGVDPAPGAHGTAMAGAIAARLRLSGTAPAARLLTARAFGPPAADGVAQGSTYHVVTCLDWAVERGARVVSMSFAGPSNALLARALAAAEAKGVIAVAAAGNAGPQSPPLFPAADPGVIAVTASDADDRVLPAANRGAHLLLTAPGVDILVAAPGGYDLTSGTSVAAAEVSGIVALLVEKRGRLTPKEAHRILLETAIDLGPAGRDPIFGAGLVDADAAVTAAARTR